MNTKAQPHEIAWLRELQRRAAAGLPPNNREVMVSLREILPKGFKPSDVNHRLLTGSTLSIEGLLAIGDETKVVPDVERAVDFIRTRLIQYPDLAQVSADDVALALNIPSTRAEYVLLLIGSLGSFIASAAGSPNGYSWIGFGGRDDIVAAYLGFESVQAIIAQWNHEPTLTGAPGLANRERPAIDTVVRDTVFILMSMDPQDAALVDVHQTIRQVCGEFGLHASRIDDIEHSDRITDRVLEQIESAEFIVADLSGERPNVYYEIGYAHALGKRPILVRRAGTRLHFDLVVHNTPEYPNITTLREILRRRFEAILGRSNQSPRST